MIYTIVFSMFFFVVITISFMAARHKKFSTEITKTRNSTRVAKVIKTIEEAISRNDVAISKDKNGVYSFIDLKKVEDEFYKNLKTCGESYALKELQKKRIITFRS